MSKTTFKDIPAGTRLLGIGNFFRSLVSDTTPWTLAALHEYQKQRDIKHYNIELACVLGVGRRFSGDEEVPFTLPTPTHAVTFPPVEEWYEGRLGNFPDL